MTLGLDSQTNLDSFGPPTRLPAYPPTRLPAYPPTRLPAYPPTRLPACPPARLPACGAASEERRGPVWSPVPFVCFCW